MSGIPTDGGTTGESPDYGPPPRPAVDDWAMVTEGLIPIVNLVALIGGLLILLDLEFTGRSWAAVVLYLLGPGSGIVLLIGRFDPALRWVLTVGLSVAFSVLTAQLLLSLHAIDSTWGAAILTLVTALGLVARARTSRLKRANR